MGPHGRQDKRGNGCLTDEGEDELTGAFLHTGGTEAVLSLWVNVHLVRGGVVQHERWAGVLARGFITEPAADLS